MTPQLTLFPLDNPPLMAERGIVCHSIENNPASQKNLDENKTHFKKQTQELYNGLMNGEVHNADTARAKYGIRHLPRRIKDIVDAKFQLTKQPIPGAHGMLNHFMTKEQREFNLGRERE